ncbi:MAG: hypothetical protein HYT43_00140 [Candidatus Taylorbacteria bacterium]|nr:hypothetical protein [Candidatus Taylorbacteria bacterium]
MLQPKGNFITRQRRIALFAEAERAVEAFSLTERLIFCLIFIGLSASVAWMLTTINAAFLVEVPARGGTLTEGIIGTPRSINPLLAITDADKDLVALIYAGLLKATPSGELIPDMAESVSVSPDGREYTFFIRADAYFHDGTPVTADDVIFTVTRAQDPVTRSPKRANWDGITVEKIDDKTIRFALKEPYPPFLENATLGLLPRHLWRDVGPDEFAWSQWNIEPVGSGPYKLSKLKTNESRLPYLYILRSFRKYPLGEPKIQKIVFTFFGNERAGLEALRRREIGSIGSLSPRETLDLSANARLDRYPLPRVFGVFFNQNQAPVLSLREVRQALNTATDREIIVREVLRGFGSPIDSPVPLSLPPNANAASTSAAAGRALLEKNGWSWNEEKQVMEKKSRKETYTLAFSISTSDAEELRGAAELLKDQWEKIGARIELKIFETGDLNQDVIRPRKYDSLLFGEIVGRELDLFAFWHSSQRNDPGLNIALYADAAADKLLEEARAASELTVRREKYQRFAEILTEDVPAVFLYSPDFIYVLPREVKGVGLGSITTAAERFLNVHEWYIETDKVWNIFVNKN